MTARLKANRSSERMRRATVALALAAALVAGCNDDAPGDDAGTPAVEPVVKTADRGPVKLDVTADKSEITIAERLNLAIEVTADAGIEIRMPQFGEALNEFQIRDFQSPPPEELADGRKRYEQSYNLDIFLSGEYAIPAVTVRYRDRRGEPAETEPAELPATEVSDNGAEDDASLWAELSTEPFTIQVRSLLEGEFDPADFRDVKGVAEVPVDRSWTWVAWVVAGTLGGLGLLIVAILLIVRRLRRPRRAIVIPPDQWAFRELQRLSEAGLVEEGRAREFYYRLSEIVRTYIELRFGLMAPERTTEEFLEEMQRNRVLPEQHRPHLAQFLEACDLVKYARYEPGVEEIEDVFNAARDFVEATRPQQPPAAAQPAPHRQEVPV